jgi:hypothetical protein
MKLLLLIREEYKRRKRLVPKVHEVALTNILPGSVSADFFFYK